MSVHVRSLPSGAKRYEVRWREGDRNRSRMFTLRKDADAFDAELRRMRQAGELAAQLERRRLTVSDLTADWWQRAALAPRTRETYAVQLDLRVIPAFGDRRVAQLTVADVERWIAELRDQGVGAPTIVKSVTVLQAILSTAVRDGVVAVNVAQQARKPSQGRTRIPHIVTPEQVEAVRAILAAKGRERDVVLLDLLAYAGLRPESEALPLTWRSVRDRSLLIRDTKRGRERTIPMIDPLRASLAEWRLRRGRPRVDELVIPTSDGNAWTRSDWRNWRHRHFDPAAETAGLPADVRPRDLRSSFVSLMVHEGRSIVEVARWVGHSPEICLRDYAQIFDDTDPAHRVPAAERIRTAREMFAPSSHDTPEEEASC